VRNLTTRPGTCPRECAAHYRHTPFGEAFAHAGLDRDRTYTSHRYDRDTGLVYTPFRHYDPATMRWLTRDPIAVPGANPYEYCYHSPVVYRDLDGLKGQPDVGMLADFGSGENLPRTLGGFYARAPMAGGGGEAAVNFGAGFYEAFLPGDLLASCYTLEDAAQSGNWWGETTRDIAIFFATGGVGGVRLGGGFRSGLIKVSGRDPGPWYHAHHNFPRKFAPYWDRIGLNWRDPRYGSWWIAPDHLAKAFEFNRRWEVYIRTKEPTLQQAIRFGRRLARGYGLEVYF
jgi:RHS repeat-associated protein